MINDNSRPRPKSLASRPHEHGSGRRGVASASLYESAADDFIPFESSGNGNSIRSPFYRIPLQHDTTRNVENPVTPLILHDPMPTIPSVFRTIKGVGGGLFELHQTLYACLQVGRLDRATALLKRLNAIYKPEMPELIAAHNAYLREILLRISRDGDEALLGHIHHWFAVQIQGVGIKGDATTFAAMIHASLFEPKGKQRKRSITRYVNLANEAGVRDETILTASEHCSDEDIDLLYQVASPTAAGTVEIESEVPSPIARSNEVPQVRAAPLKGLGLSTLQKSLSLVDSDGPTEPNSDDGTSETLLEKRLRLQHRLEQSTLEFAIDRWREEELENRKLGINSALASASLGSLMWTWHEKLAPRLEDEIRKANEAESPHSLSQKDVERRLYGPFLQYISPQKLSAAVILSTMTIMTKRQTKDSLASAMRISQLASTVGEMVLEESIVQARRDQEEKRAVARPKGMSSKMKKPSQQLLRKLARYGQPPQDLQWTVEIKARVGAALLGHLFEVAKVKVSAKASDTNEEIVDEQPAFLHAFVLSQRKKLGVVRFHNALMEKLGKEPLGALLAKNLPMLAEPKPWTGFQSGGFFEQTHPIVRLKENDYQLKRYVQAAAQNGDLEQVFTGLNILGKTAWTINRPVFEVLLQAWNDGGTLAKIPPHDPIVEYPPEPASSDTAKERVQWIKEIRRLENHKTGLKTQRCFQNFQVEIARAYLGKTFYFPHNIDFRGRAYSMTPFFNQMSADNVRGLLLFEKGKVLGEEGLRWLKIHLANVFGYDKANLSDREQFATDHLSDIHDSVTNPLGGRRWWLQAEDPWQCLATCMELQKALDSGDPFTFVSHLPVHQDGTCNGLQHYAALGGDPAGAKEVNLEPGDRPADIYTAVADSVRKSIEEDADVGIELAKLLKTRIKRKIVKQTVMTNVYGVTFIGAQRQVKKQLEDFYDDLAQQGPLSYTTAAYYIAGKIFKALSAMFTGAHDIQFWFGDCANRICQSLAPLQIEKLKKVSSGVAVISPYKSKPSGNPKEDPRMAFRTPVIWTTPLRLPVVQPYRKLEPRIVKTNIQRIKLQAPSTLDPINKRRQLQAFPPNFIHSLDATHMILTATKCDELGLTFSAVHDSFWTHACDVDTMNTVIREAFIKLHSEDIIGRLAAEFETRYKGYMVLVPVKRYSSVGRKLQAFRKENPIHVEEGKKGSRRKAKLHKQQIELLQEVKRLELLASANPEDRRKGEAIITPSKIFAEMGGEEDAASVEDLGQSGLGYVPSRRETTKARSAREEENDDMENDTESAEVSEAKEDWSVQALEKVILGSKKKSRPLHTAIDYVWQQLTFPSVPKKVCFVQRTSTYARTNCYSG